MLCVRVADFSDHVCKYFQLFHRYWFRFCMGDVSKSLLVSKAFSLVLSRPLHPHVKEEQREVTFSVCLQQELCVCGCCRNHY